MFGFGSSKKKKIFILLGEEDSDTLCGQFAAEYEQAAIRAGHEVRRANLGDIKFDPLLHKGYKVMQEIEPDLKKVQEDMRWAEHIVIIHPMWWSTMPAILKGFFDRVWLPGFAFHFHKNNMGWDKLLKGRTGHIIMTMDSWPLMQRMLFGDSTNELGRAILGFSGIHPVKITKIGPLKGVSQAHLERCHNWVKSIGSKAK